MYKVPRWVFISDKLPGKYQFNKSIPAFRQFSKSNADIFSEYKIRNLITKIEEYRNLILELREDIGEHIDIFKPIRLASDTTPNHVAKQIREWLNVTGNLDFFHWKEELEDKGIFIFLTSKYTGWSHIDKEFLRGLTIYHSKLPVIIINDSDSKKAQSFTLFHELAHLIRKENAIDIWEENSIQIEKWCDELAGNVLMPIKQFNDIVENSVDLDTVKSLAKTFIVSPYACLVRLKQLQKITQSVYQDIENKLNNEFKQFQKKLKESKGGPARNRVKEVINQYGHIYTTTVFQAYHNKEIGLLKLTNLLELKKPSYILDMEAQL
ncbi:MAG TPA: ImmA/IrrE family metallo-endopeptidase [Ignavibacteria bacterium]|nr:ImmA/IrrE family metallo-endopeptidase [Ignavibacteria bacterium]